jgi:hypothetical protein
MKKILHFQLPINNRGSILIPMELAGKFINLAQNRVGNEWAVIASPCVASVLEDDGNFKNFVLSNISEEELLELFK